MKNTPLYQLHIDAGAKMGEFAGFDMPLFYPLGVMKEHLHTRESAGLFDVSHMMQVSVTGGGVADLIARLCPYDPSSQELGVAKYTYFLNEDAGIIDDLIVTRLENERFLLVCNAGCAEKDEQHIRSVAEAFDVNIEILPRALLALQGPKAEAVLTSLGLDAAGLSFMHASEPQEGWMLSRAGYTGEDGFEIAMPIDEAVSFAQKLLDQNDVEWIGLGARDSLRLEAGLPLYGQDLSDTITPHEAGLIWAIPKDLREGGPFIGASKLAERIAEGRKRMRVGLLPEGRPVRAGADIKNLDGEVVGQITSGGFGPTKNAPVALGLVSVEAADSPLVADLRGKDVPLSREKLPFVPHTYKR